MELSGYCFYMNPNIKGNFQIRISVPLIAEAENEDAMSVCGLVLFDKISVDLMLNSSCDPCDLSRGSLENVSPQHRSDIVQTTILSICSPSYPRTYCTDTVILAYRPPLSYMKGQESQK